MAISSMALAIASFVLRIFSLLFLAASVVVMVANNVKDSVHFYDMHADSTKDQFSDHITYSIASLYTLIQIPFGVYHLCNGKRWIRNGCLPIFDLYFDTLISFLLATATGAGFAVTCELRKYVDRLEEAGVDAEFGQTKKYLDVVYVSIGLLFLGSICMAILSINSSYFRKFK